MAHPEVTRDALIRIHKTLCDTARLLMASKNKDYTGGGGTFANFKTASLVNVHPVKGALIRLMDKLQRVNSFIEQGLVVSDESVIDTIVDAINYPVLIAGMILEDLPQEKRLEMLKKMTDRLGELEELMPDEHPGRLVSPSSIDS